MEHKVSLQRIRAAIEFIRKTDPGSRHPLVEAQFATAGVDHFVERSGDLFGITAAGTQMAIRACLERYLRRVDRDSLGRVARLYPFTRSRRGEDHPRFVVIDPAVLYGGPVIAGTRIATAVIYERWKAGESLAELAEDYQRTAEEVEEALRCENPAAAA